MFYGKITSHFFVLPSMSAKVFRSTKLRFFLVVNLDKIVTWCHLKLIFQIPSFFSMLIGHSAVICLVRKNRQVKSSLRPGEKDTDLLGFEPPTSRSNTWCIRPKTRCPATLHSCLISMAVFPTLLNIVVRRWVFLIQDPS